MRCALDRAETVAKVGVAIIIAYWIGLILFCAAQSAG